MPSEMTSEDCPLEAPGCGKGGRSTSPDSGWHNVEVITGSLQICTECRRPSGAGLCATLRSDMGKQCDALSEMFIDVKKTKWMDVGVSLVASHSGESFKDPF